MAPKKKKNQTKPTGKRKNKLSDEAPDGVRSYKFITLEEMQARELSYLNRMHDLRACLNYMEDMLAKVAELQEQDEIIAKWHKYLSCDGLPKPYLPPDIRTFFEKLYTQEVASVERNIDWKLSIDERSILSQDISRVEYTREDCMAAYRPNFGYEYDNYIELSLKVLKSIEYYLANERMVTKAKPRILLDIIQQKTDIQDRIHGFIDRFTYRVICGEDTNMDSVDARTADYFFKGTNFQVHMWTIKNVPILFEFLEDPIMTADLHCLNVKVILPFSVLEDNLTIRGCHFEFDHFSEHAKSFTQRIRVQGGEHLIAGITDLYESLYEEWLMQVDIQTEILNKMNRRRQEYEDRMKQIEDEEAQRAKPSATPDIPEKKKKKNKKPKPIKYPKEVPPVPQNMFPDVWHEFLDREDRQYQEFINMSYHPNHLNLERGEINLKRFIIMGGVYQLHFVIKPLHFDFQTFNITLHSEGRNLIYKKDAHIQSGYLEEPVRQFYSKMSILGFPTADTEKPRKSGVTMHSEHVAFTHELTEYDAEFSPWFVLTFTLPDYLCFWGEPRACHYEDDVIGYFEEGEEEDIFTHAASKTMKVSTRSENRSEVSKTSKSTEAPSTAKDLELQAAAPGHDDYDKKSIHSATPTHRSSNAFRSSAVATMLGSIVPRPSGDPNQLQVEDFNLNIIFNKQQLRNLARHCMPRIISSFKFPKELTIEAAADKSRAKSAGGTLVRRRLSIEQHTDRTFLNLAQYNPERLFPIFETPEPLDITKSTHHSSEPETFYQLIDTFDEVKLYYRARHRRQLDLPSFKATTKKVKLPIMKSEILADEPGDMSRRSRSSIASRHSVASIKLHHSEHETKSSRGSAFSKKPDLEGDNERETEGERHGETEKTESLHNDDTKFSLPSMESIEKIDNRKTYKYAHWTSKYIKYSIFDAERRQLTIWTDRLGTIGFACKRYEHFPFRFWSLEPNPDDPENEVVFTLETQYVRAVLFVRSEGVSGYVTDRGKKYVRNRRMYLEIEEPLNDFMELKRIFCEKNLNIFTDHDASFYIENGYFSEKHLATELHSYCCMAQHAALMRFQYSSWNRLATRRNMVLQLAHHRQDDDSLCTVRIQPEVASFVTIKELCSNNLDVFKLEYSPTWRNVEPYSDLHKLITSMYPAAPELRVKNPYLLATLKNLLWEVRPLSYS